MIRSLVGESRRPGVGVKGLGNHHWRTHFEGR